MAITDIQATVLANTGRTPTANSIEDAQRFVVSSIPKNLLRWAVTETVPATHGGDNDPQQVTLPIDSDNIISVRRDSYVAEEVKVEERGFIGNSSSLKKATNVFPKYYIADGNRVIAKPDPDATYKIYVMYIDYSKLDDDSDLRNIVINYASSKEFTALAISTTFPSLSWGKETPPSFSPPSLQQPDWADVENWITTEEDSEMLNSRISAIQSQIAEYNAKLQSAQAEFNSELQDYQSRLSETVQLNQGEIAEWQSQNSVKLSHYLQSAAQHYNWAIAEIKSYTENNTRTLDRVLEIQRGK